MLENGTCKLGADLTQPARKACLASAPALQDRAHSGPGSEAWEGVSSSRASMDQRSTLSLSQPAPKVLTPLPQVGLRSERLGRGRKEELDTEDACSWAPLPEHCSKGDPGTL